MLVLLLAEWLGLPQKSEGADHIPSPAELQTGLHYFVVQNLDNASAPILRGKAGTQGYAHDSIILAANTRYREWILQASTLKVATGKYTTPGNGSRFELPEFRLETVTTG